MAKLLKKSIQKKAKKKKVSAKAVVLHDEKVLLLKQKDGRWDLPGGKADKKEGVAQALKREVKEETGLKVKPEKHLTVTNRVRMRRKNLLVLSFLCSPQKKIGKKRIKLSHEHKDYKLVDIKKAKKLKMRKRHKKAITAAHRHLKKA